MIIKGVFRRYERWNPVHPTSGAFWGMGLGIGCGVGWGPGFGPEAIGYVGAGCGVGFSVGITLAGFGIGLPANYLFELPCTAISTTGRAALSLAQHSGLHSAKDVAEKRWNNVLPRISALQREIGGGSYRFNKNEYSDKVVNLFDMRSLSTAVGEFLSRFIRPRKGTSTGYGET